MEDLSCNCSDIGWCEKKPIYHLPACATLFRPVVNAVNNIKADE